MKPNCAHCGERELLAGLEIAGVNKIEVDESGHIESNSGPPAPHWFLFCSARCLGLWVGRNRNKLERAERAAKRKPRRLPAA
jgi:hypothetical protein